MIRIGLGLIGFAVFSTDCINLLINHYMDFVIVTPDEVIAYNQEWFFARSNKTLGADKVKSINVLRTWFLGSILNEWDMVFSGDGATTIDMVKENIHEPDVFKQRILDLREKHPHHKNT